MAACHVDRSIFYLLYDWCVNVVCHISTHTSSNCKAARPLDPSLSDSATSPLPTVTMSDDGERTCPLCAEEMDLTDQQLKPCKCGYEICIWCWHHIIEMAEKEDTEARCPACRTPYDKDRVLKVAAANSERIIAEMYSEKKQKSQRAKTKISAEAMKHLSTVRVMQKNLVYITGLPTNLCDENILERKEYFGQYGKVLKVSISRPAGTSFQKTSNSAFGVYITYAKDEEAVRCIQAVHNFVLEGKSLRACYGTTKYCRAWLRNMTCSNPDCLYLHDIGSQEDSFTKDEIISAYTRSRVPQIASSNAQRRSGNVLPSPMDDLDNNGTVLDKHLVKSACNTASSQVKGIPLNTSAGKSNALPAAASWGLRGSNCRLLASSVQCSQTHAKQKIPESKEAVGAISGPLEPLQLGTLADLRLTSETIVNDDSSLRPSSNDDVIVTSKPGEEIKMAELDDRSRRLEYLRPDTGRQHQTSSSEWSKQVVSEISDTSVSSGSLSSSPAVALEEKERDIALNCSDMKPRNTIISKNHVRQFSNSGPDRVTHDSTVVNGDVQNMGSGFSSVNIDRHDMENQLEIDQHQTLSSDLWSSESPRSRDIDSAPVALSTNELTDWNYKRPKQQLISFMDGKEDSVKVHNNQSLPCLSHRDNNTNHASSTSCSDGLGIKQHQYIDSSLDMVREQVTMCSLGDKESAAHNGHREDDMSSNSFSRSDLSCPGFNCTEENMRIGGDNNSSVDKMGESNIISDILSLDFDPWDDSLSSSNSLAKLLGEKEEQDGSFKLSNSWRSLTSNQSRFSFARQESQASLLEPHVGEIDNAQRLHSLSQDSYKDSFHNRLQFNDSEGSYVITSGETLSDRTTSVSKAKITAPPGFSAPSRAPPPGFSIPDRFNQAYEAYTEKHMLGCSSGGNSYQSDLIGNSCDVEFIDPAILAIGKGRVHLGPNNSAFGLKASFPEQFCTSNSDPRLHLVMQQSVSSNQNMRIPDHMGERFLPLNDAYIASQLLAKSHSSVSPFAQLSYQQLRNSPFPNNQWDACNSHNSIRTGNDIGLSEIFRNERFGLNDYYTNTHEDKFHIPRTVQIFLRQKIWTFFQKFSESLIFGQFPSTGRGGIHWFHCAPNPLSLAFLSDKT
ncbi:hypothetical protein OPV22_031153 [Ensete ventricosum]|uniref:RING-type domain-containing protein n=1 Tax=Ensete ventricosum TaxID=4639 RepID=A0AAV8PRZ8_ENSVE|nr:hypothetical protein OPV22_031153 [Ensete ventricosum]